MELPTEKRKLPPGVRFHPTNVELLLYYLRGMVSGKPPEPGFVAEVDIYKFHPAALKDRAYFSEELNWYFFCSAGNKYKSGGRKNRAAPHGYWKPTGNDKVVSIGKMVVGHIKFLVFHEGKSPNGVRTGWVMHEYRLEPSLLKAAQLKAAKLGGNDGESAEFVVCKIFDKGGLGPRNGEQFGSAYNEDEWSNTTVENTTTVKQVESDVVSLSVVHQASTPTSNGANANPFHGNPTAGPETASSSLDPVPDCTDEMFCAAEFGVTYIKLNDLPYITLDDLDMPI